MSSANDLHFITTLGSAMLLFLVGTAVLLRNKESSVNRLMFGFFVFIGVYQLLDALLVVLVDAGNGIIDGGTFEADFIRKASILFLMLAFLLGTPAILSLYYGEDFILKEKRSQIIGLGLFGLLAFLAILGENTIGHENGQLIGVPHFHTGIDRDLSGFIGFYGLILITTFAMIVVLLNLIANSSGDTRGKLVRLLVGIVLIVSVVMSLDASQVLGDLAFLISENIFHEGLHVILLLGELLILSAFWAPFKAVSHIITSEHTQSTPIEG